MSMSIPYELSGRTQQKARTRAALVAAARELLSEGTTPTVEQAADRAAISRTTAYRYFRNRRELLVASYPELQEVVTRSITRQVVEHEPELRAMLRMSLETPRPDDESLPLRRGRAIDWIEDALSPLRDRMHERELHRLALAIRAAIGIEALVWLTDVGGLSRGDAVDLMRSSARALLQAAVAGADGDRR
jgi:AcrR family transcriptional regulator